MPAAPSQPNSPSRYRLPVKPGPPPAPDEEKYVATSAFQEPCARTLGQIDRDRSVRTPTNKTLAASRGPGWRLLRGLCSAIWLYLGLVAALVLPHHPGSWGRLGGAGAVLVGVGFGVAAWRGSERELTDTHRDLP
jgi:hypothetical protein